MAAHETDVRVGGGEFTFTNPVTQQCPFPVYDQLRESAPIYRDPMTGHYILTRYTEIRQVVLRPEEFSSDTGLVSKRRSVQQEQVNNIYLEKAGHLPATVITALDPPEHGAHRAPLNRIFDARSVQALEPRIRELADRLIDEFVDKKSVEFVSAFAARLPMHVIAEQLGFEPDRHEDFKRWSGARLEIIDPGLGPEKELALASVIGELYKFLVDQIERLRKTREDTLFGRLVNLRDEGGSFLKTSELIALGEGLLVAGNETTALAIANGMRILAGDGRLAEELACDPGKVPLFTEEVLRVFAPLQTHFRAAKRDVAIGGTKIPKGSVIEVRYGAANRDPGVYKSAAKIDLARRNTRPHLAFGAGVHICVGLQLARAEINIAFERLLARLKDFRLTDGGALHFCTAYQSHGVTRLDLTFDNRLVERST